MSKNHACVQQIKGSNITVKEHGRRANFLNPKRDVYLKIRVDDCLVKEGARADWIVTKKGVGSVIVELKGKDIHHACTQLFATLQHGDCQSWLEEKRALLIMCSRKPSFDSSTGRLQLEARKRGVRLTVKCTEDNFIIEKLLHS